MQTVEGVYSLTMNVLLIQLWCHAYKSGLKVWVQGTYRKEYTRIVVTASDTARHAGMNTPSSSFLEGPRGVFRLLDTIASERTSLW